MKTNKVEESNNIAPRQLYFILAAFAPVTKLLLMPSTVAFYAKGDLLFSTFLDFLMQGIMIALILWLSTKTDKTFFQLLENTFGKVVAQIVSFVFALYFIFSVLVPLLEQKAFVMTVFYDSIPTLLVFLPFFLFSTYASAKGLRAIGRSADLCLPFFIISFGVLLLMSFGSADFTRLLPFSTQPFSKVGQGSLRILTWFSDSALILGLLGHWKAEKGIVWKGVVSYASGAIAVLVFLGVFYGIFYTISLRETYAIAKTARYFSALETIGRVDLFFIYLYSFVNVFALVIPIQLSVNFMGQAFRYDNRALFSAIVNGILLLFVYFFNYSYAAVEEYINGKLFYIYLIFAEGFPIVALFLRRKHE